MFGLGGDPFQGQQGPWSAGPGPLGDLQNQVAGILNNADQNHIYIPTGAGEPTIIIPRPRPRQGYRPAGPVGSGPLQGPLTRGDVGVLLVRQSPFIY
jgi:hypothetical protein